MRHSYVFYAVVLLVEAVVLLVEQHGEVAECESDEIEIGHNEHIPRRLHNIPVSLLFAIQLGLHGSTAWHSDCLHVVDFSIGIGFMIAPFMSWSAIDPFYAFGFLRDDVACPSLLLVNLFRHSPYCAT
jgi:hypothetical protein